MVTEMHRGGYNRFGGLFSKYLNGTDSGSDSTGTNRPESNLPGGWHGKDSYHLGLSEPAEPGQKSTGKKS